MVHPDYTSWVRLESICSMQRLRKISCSIELTLTFPDMIIVAVTNTHNYKNTQSTTSLMNSAKITTKLLISSFMMLSGLLLISGPLNAVPQWILDFSSVTSGDPPPTAAYQNGVVNTLGQSILNNDNQLTVQSTFTIGSASLSDAMVFSKTDTQGGVEYALITSATDFTAGASYRVDFNILLPAFNTMSTVPFDIRMTPGGPGGSFQSLGNILFLNNGSVTLDSSYANSQGFSDSWTPETVHSVSLRYDGGANIFSAYIDDSLVGSLTLDQALLPDNPLGVERVRFRAQGSNEFFFFDPIGISDVVAVPEPSYAVLITSLIVMLFIWRRNKVRS